jgi:hypothetical protein
MIAASLRSAILANLYLAGSPVSLSILSADPLINRSEADLMPILAELVGEQPAIVVDRGDGFYTVVNAVFQDVPGADPADNTALSALAAALNVNVNELEIFLASFRQAGFTAGSLVHDAVVCAAAAHVIASRLPQGHPANDLRGAFLRVAKVCEGVAGAGL